jgi:CheY-like chemotaxis protein
MNGEKIKLLVVEDNLADAREIGQALRENNWDDFVMTLVDTLPRALKKLSEEKMDLILLDLSLPGTSGIETLEQIHAAASNAPPPGKTGPNNPNPPRQPWKKGLFLLFKRLRVDARPFEISPGLRGIQQASILTGASPDF